MLCVVRAGLGVVAALLALVGLRVGVPRSARLAPGTGGGRALQGPCHRGGGVYPPAVRAESRRSVSGRRNELRARRERRGCGGPHLPRRRRCRPGEPLMAGVRRPTRPGARRRYLVDVADETKPFLLYDGECSFCRAGSEWITARSQVPAVPWQQLGAEELRRLGLTLAQAEGAAWWIDPTARAERGHLAIARAPLGRAGIAVAPGPGLARPPVLLARSRRLSAAFPLATPPSRSRRAGPATRRR